MSAAQNDAQQHHRGGRLAGPASAGRAAAIIREVESGKLASDVARQFGVTRQSVSQILRDCRPDLMPAGEDREMRVTSPEIPGDRNAGGCGGLSAPFLDVSSFTLAAPHKGAVFLGRNAEVESPPYSHACNSGFSSRGIYSVEGRAA